MLKHLPSAMMDASDDEADEDLDHLGSVEAVPRSDADHLKQLNSLGITAQNEGVDAVDDESELEDLQPDSTSNSMETQLLKGGPSWFKANLPVMDVQQMLARHCLMRACNCHIEVKICPRQTFLPSTRGSPPKPRPSCAFPSTSFKAASYNTMVAVPSPKTLKRRRIWMVLT